MKNLLAAVVFPVSVLLVACQPPPPPTECSWVTAEEFDAVKEGMSLAEVEAILGKDLTLTTQYSIQRFRQSTLHFTTYTWFQDRETNGCNQYVGFDFVEDEFTSGFFGEVVK